MYLGGQPIGRSSRCPHWPDPLRTMNCRSSWLNSIATAEHRRGETLAEKENGGPRGKCLVLSAQSLRCHHTGQRQQNLCRASDPCAIVRWGRFGCDVVI